MAAPDGNAKVPVTVVTGFLGAGKTTLVNYILQGNHGKSIAVIENEYGEVGIDDSLVNTRKETKEEIFEMNNGCVCCTVRGDLIRMLTKLLKRKKKFDAIVIETTGLANPGPVIQTFFVDNDIKEECALDAVLTVVDAKHAMQHLDEVKPEGITNEAVQQVAFADKVLLNKIDLVSSAEKAAVVRRIHGLNRGVEIIECQQAVVDLGRVLGIQSFTIDKLLEKDPEFFDDGPPPAHDHDHHHHHHGHEHDDHDHEHGDCHDKNCQDASHHHAPHGKDKHGGGHHHDHVHDHSVSSVGIQLEGACDMRKLNGWLSQLLQERGADLFRSKGIFSIAGSDDKFVFQGVHMLLQFTSSAEGAGRPWQPGEKRVNKIVFIGRKLNRAELTAAFQACVVPA